MSDSRFVVSTDTVTIGLTQGTVSEVNDWENGASLAGSGGCGEFMEGAFIGV
jgi:hypothetical protein